METEFRNEDVTDGMREVRKLCPYCWYCGAEKIKKSMYCDKCEAFRQDLIRPHRKPQTLIKANSTNVGKYWLEKKRLLGL